MISRIKLTEEQAEALFMNDGNESLTVIDSGEWGQDGKYQNCYFIYKDKETGRFYRMWVSRSGSYHSDWYYEFYDTELTEVAKQEVTIFDWKPVNE